MKNILFTDTHFGVRNNSLTWLESQKAFVYKQLIPFIESLDDRVRLIHLGDVFDSRSTISTKVATDVVDMFTLLNKKVDEFIIIGGNHDYYSPNSDSVCSIDLLLNQTGATLVTKKELYLGDMAFIPWYRWGDKDIQENIDNLGIKHIFTHTDIVSGIIPYNGVNIYSGHMHIPLIRKSKGLFNLGSCYSIDFGDSNRDRGFYVLDGENFEFIPNKHSIKFWRLYGGEILEDRPDIRSGDYIELYISEKDMLRSDYTEAINRWVGGYKNIWVIPTSENVSIDLKTVDRFDIKDITRRLIDEELMDKYNMVVNYRADD